jgi:hypothetical protein
VNSSWHSRAGGGSRSPWSRGVTSIGRWRTPLGALGLVAAAGLHGVTEPRALGGGLVGRRRESQTGAASGGEASRVMENGE